MTILKRMLVLMAALMGVMGLYAGGAFASTQRSTYGQCGPAVHNGSQLVNAWGAMNVLNTSAASTISKSAGWKPMDGGMVSYITQRGREFKLAKPANVKDFGCKVGEMYSVGTRHYGAGESVIGIVPMKYSPYQISGSPHKGYHRVTIWVHVVGRGSCANGFQALVLVVAYVPNTPAKPAPKKPKAPAPKPAPKPAPPPTGSCNVNNSPGAVVCSTFYVFVTCGGAQVTINGSTKEEAIANAKAYSDSHDCNTVVITTPPTPPSPPTPVCPAGTTGTPPNCVTPPVSLPPIVSVDFVQEFDTSDYSVSPAILAQGPICARVQATNGDILKLTFSVGYGILDQYVLNPVMANGSQQRICVTYTAPTDPGSDQATVTVDDLTAKTRAQAQSNVFGIIAPTPPPGS